MTDATARQPTFSVIVPTTGRSTLGGTLSSIARELRPGDEIIVVCNEDGDLGTKARNSGMSRARGSHLLFIDDDDEYVDGAFAAMRSFASVHPDRVGVFREELLDGRLLWRDAELREGNVGSVMVVVPNLPDRLAPWDGTEGNDWLFISRTAALQGEPMFVDAVVARQRPNGPFASRLAELRFRLRLRTRLRRLAGGG